MFNRLFASKFRTLAAATVCLLLTGKAYADRLIDDLNDFSKAYSVGLSITSDDGSYSGGDTSRAQRLDNSANPAYLIYRTPGAQQLTVLAQFLPNNEPIVDFTFYSSTDGVTWNPQTNWTSPPDTPTWGGWGVSRLYTISSLPNNTTFIKVQFRSGGVANWTPQLSQVVIDYTPPPDGDNPLTSITQLPNGNIGIGTQTPDTTLTVGGDMHLQRPGGSSLYIQTPPSDVRILTVGTSPLLLGANSNVHQLVLAPNGTVGIGTSNPTTSLTVKGAITADQVIVASVGADFVFADDYKLLPLNEVEQRIKSAKHLPDVPSAAEVQTNGMSVGDMQTKLLQKVEELTLYVIDLKKENEALKTRVATLESK